MVDGDGTAEEVGAATLGYGEVGAVTTGAPEGEPPEHATKTTAKTGVATHASRGIEVLPGTLARPSGGSRIRSATAVVTLVAAPPLPIEAVLPAASLMAAARVR